MHTVATRNLQTQKFFSLILFFQNTDVEYVLAWIVKIVELMLYYDNGYIDVGL